MFTELPKLLGRDFAIGTFLPSIVFLAALWPVTKGSGSAEGLLKGLETISAVGATVFLLIAWLLAVALASMNRLIYRLLEGYGSLNPLRPFVYIERYRFRTLKAQITRLVDHVTTSEGKTDLRANAKLAMLGRLFARRYPDQEGWVLPTSFGNTIRAFEVYPRVVYGVEGIQGWLRLLPVIPKEYLDAVNSAKTQGDFWVNLLVLSVVAMVYHLAVAGGHVDSAMRWMLVSGTVACFAFYALSRQAMEQWGELVKAAFDVYLLELQTKLGIANEPSSIAPREIWERRSQSMIYRRPVA